MQSNGQSEEAQLLTPLQQLDGLLGLRSLFTEIGQDFDEFLPGLIHGFSTEEMMRPIGTDWHETEIRKAYELQRRKRSG